MKHVGSTLALLGVIAFNLPSTSAVAQMAWDSHQMPVVRDARTAIRLARIMQAALVGMDPDSTRYAWEEECQAKLKNGIWIVTAKTPRPAVGAPCTGAAEVYIGAQDGRFMGQMWRN
jgi:hypothetical protein